GSQRESSCGSGAGSAATAHAPDRDRCASPTGRWRRLRAHETGARAAPSGSLRRALAEQALRPEDQDRDQDREDERPRPVTTGREPRKPLVEGLDQPDQERADDVFFNDSATTENRGR